MSRFHAGLRCRITGAFGGQALGQVGKECTVVAPADFWDGGKTVSGWQVEIDGETASCWHWAFTEYQLEPLTNPGVDSIITSILKEPGADFNIPGFMPEEWKRAWDNA